MGGIANLFLGYGQCKLQRSEVYGNKHGNYAQASIIETDQDHLRRNDGFEMYVVHNDMDMRKHLDAYGLYSMKIMVNDQSVQLQL